MYLEHFGLSEPPFRITPHTDFFFEGANRGATLDALMYAIMHDEGIVKVSGEVGSGKTMLCRVLMERLPETVTIIYLANPSLSRDDILYAIADELRLDVPDNARSSVVMRSLYDHLITSYGEGRQVVVLIDEAHAMPVETLEEIRLLSNLETNRNKLLQLVLFGQPELNDILARPDMRQLKERITHNFGLEPLVRQDISDYIDFRMRAAGYRGPSVFSPAALKMIEQSSLGLTRRINILADKSLLAAFSSGSHQIGPKEIQIAIRDCEFSGATYGTKKRQKARLQWLAGALAAGSLAGTIWLVATSRTETLAPAASVAPAVTPATAAPVQPPAVTTAPPPSAPASPAESATPPHEAAVANAAAVPPQTAAEPSPPLAAAPTVASMSPTSAATDPTVIAPQLRHKIGKLTRKHLETGNAWQTTVPDDHWFIQVLSVDAERHGEVETLLRRLSASAIDMDNVRAYYSELSGKPRFGVIYGDYPSRAAASASLSDMPKALRTSKPYPRQAVRLR